MIKLPCFYVKYKECKSLNTESRRYPTYQYIKFIWQKKIYLIGFTILCLLLGAVYSYSRGTSATTTAVIFTGNANNDMLSKPDLIAAKYSRYLSKDIKGSFQAQIADKMEITLSAKGKNKNTLESQVGKAAKKYVQDLTTNFNAQNNVRINYANSVQKEIDATQQSIALYDQLLANHPTGQTADNYNQALVTNQDALQSERSDLLDTQYQITTAEKPQLMSVTTKGTSHNTIRNSLLGAAFGFWVALVVLIFWKYISDARRYNA